VRGGAHRIDRTRIGDRRWGIGDRRYGLDFELRLSIFDERMDASRTCGDAAAAADAEVVVEEQERGG
jgi:hypothetical protein